MGQINTNNYPTVDSLSDVDLLIVENAQNGTGTTTPKQLRENAIGTDPLQTVSQTVTGAINELKNKIAGVACYDVDTITSGFLGQFSGSIDLLLLHLTTDGTADADNGYMMLLSYSGSVARLAYGRLYDRVMEMGYDRKIYSGSTLLCEIMDEGTGTEADPIHVDVLGVIDGYVTAGWGRQSALGDRATAEGIGTEASGNYAHAHGYQTTASGNQSTAMGYSTTASADGATAMGNGTTASGVNSIAGGYNTQASGAVSTAIGTNTQATQQAQLAAGKYNKANNDALVMVGNGTGASARSNALEVLLNGDVVAGNEIIDGQGNTLSVLAEALTKTASGNPVVFSDCAGGKARSLKTTINAIQDLHGYDKPWVGGAYKNKLDASAVTQGSFDEPTATANCVSDYTPVIGGTDYYMSGNSGYADGIYLRFYDANKTELDASTRISKYVVAFGFTAPSTAVYTRIMWYKGGGLTPTNVVNALVQLEIGTAATSYAPYSNLCPISGRTAAVLTRSDGDEISEDFTIQLGTTVYGADINWDTGVATVLDAIADMGDLTWTYNGTSQVFNSSALPGATTENVYTDAISSSYKEHQTGMSAMVNGDFRVLDGVMTVKDTAYTDATAFKTAVTGQTVCYKLATPTTIQLSATQLELLKGYNRVTVESGSIELGYIAKIS